MKLPWIAERCAIGCIGTTHPGWLACIIRRGAAAQ
jgi:hypothetical protein